jgi:G3E family GTPase
VFMVPVHVVAGFLGAGKTTTLLEILRSRSERVAVVVNDFGEAAIDPAIVREENGLSVAEIQGACVCCTAPDQFAATVLQLLETVRPERILVEPTGLARPADLVDTLRRGAVASAVDVRGVIVVLDPRVFTPSDPLQREQAEAADVVVINRTDLASEAEIQRVEAELAALWPPPRVLRTTFGRVPADILDSVAAHHHPHVHDHGSTEGWHSRSLSWNVLFSYDRLLAGLQGTGVERLKGFFRTDLGSWLVEVAGGEIHARPSPHRGDSRADLIARDPAAIDRAEKAIEATIGPDRPTGGVEVALPDGRRVVFDREDLLALPDGVPDVSAVAPGRSGVAARLSAIFDALGATAGSVVVVAGDGLATAPIPLDELSAALLVHTLDGAALPEKQGGPFRLLHPAGGPHGNVKGVARIVVRPETRR